MIKFVEWLLGYKVMEKLNTECAEAEHDVTVSRALRSHAEVVGPAMRKRLATNHFGEGMREALHQRGWKKT